MPFGIALIVAAYLTSIGVSGISRLAKSNNWAANSKVVAITEISLSSASALYSGYRVTSLVGVAAVQFGLLSGVGIIAIPILSLVGGEFLGPMIKKSIENDRRD